jgi:uncharacterized protein YqeY
MEGTMSGLMERIRADLREAMRARDEARVGVLRMLLSRLKDAQIQKSASRNDLEDEEALPVLASYAKQRRESAESFEKAGRADLAAREMREHEIVLAYLPEQLDDDGIRSVLREVIASTGAVTARDMGKVMGQAMPRLKGRADGARVQAIAREMLGA